MTAICKGSGKRVEWKGDFYYKSRQCPDCGRMIKFQTSPTQIRSRKKHSNRLVGWYNKLPAHNREMAGAEKAKAEIYKGIKERADTQERSRPE